MSAARLRTADNGARTTVLILNTHDYGDHTGGNEVFGKDAPIIAHENVRKRLQSGTTAMGRTVPPAPKGALPEITFNDLATVHANGKVIRAVHVPSGHTDGDAVMEFTQPRVIHMGDDFFNGMIAAVDKILSRIGDDVKVIPGHGPLSDKAGLRAFADMLKGTSSAVENAIRAGKTLDQMKQEKVLSQWDSWAKGFINTDRFIDTLYADLHGGAAVTSTQHHYVRFFNDRVKANRAAGSRPSLVGTVAVTVTVSS